MLKDALPLDGLNRALVIKLRHHGDVLLAAPVLDTLRTHVPSLEIDALVYDDTAPMLEGHPALAQLHRVGRRWRDEGAVRRASLEWRLFQAMRSRKYDLVVHLCEHPRGAWLARTLGARWSVAPAMPGRGRFWADSFTHLYPVPRNGRRHQVELNLDALRRLGLQPALDDRRVRIVAGDAAERRVAQVLDGQGIGERGFVHFHPASRWQFKCWPAAKCAALIDRMAGSGERMVITGTADPAEKALIADIRKRASTPFLDLSGALSIKELVALIGRAKLSICVDSMPMHVAGAVGTPVVALFGPSGDVEWGPWRVRSAVIASDHPCRPCGNDGCGGGKVSECLTTLEVDRVFEAAGRLLAPG